MDKTQIKALALRELGREETPDFLENQESDVKNLNGQYDLIYTYALSRYNWSFANQWVQLNDPVLVNSKFKYAFDLPDDFVYLRGVFLDEAYHQNTSAYELVRGRLYANEPTLFIEYTVRLAEEDLPAFFVEWFKVKLALAVAFNTTGDVNLIQYLAQKEAFEYVNAVNADSRQKGPRVLKSDYFIRCR